VITAIGHKVFTPDKKDFDFGQWSEEQHWSALGAADGTPVTVTVVRDGATLRITGKVYYTRLVLDWTSKGRAAIDALRSAAATSGQKADADELASKFSSALEKAEREAKSKWDTFVSENQAKFFGAISPDLEKALVGSDWDASYGQVGAIDLQGLLQRWIGDLTRDYEQIDWSDLPDSWRDELRARMRASLDRFANTQEEIVRNNSPDAVMAWLKAKQAELAARVRG
jgi:hypothetical protein